MNMYCPECGREVEVIDGKCPAGHLIVSAMNSSEKEPTDQTPGEAGEQAPAAQEAPAPPPSVQETEAVQFKKGDLVVLARELVSEGTVIFRKGEIVVLKRVIEEPGQAETTYVATSDANGGAYRLSASYLAKAQEDEIALYPVCGKCGQVVRPSDTYCPICNEPVAEEQAQPAPAQEPQAFCVTCGAQVSPNAKFCKSCGSPSGLGAQSSPGQAAGSQTYQAGYQQQPVARQGPKPVVAMPMGIICPNCQSRAIGGGERPSWTIVVAVCLFPIGLLALLYKEPYYCTNCGYTWKASGI